MWDDDIPSMDALRAAEPRPGQPDKNGAGTAGLDRLTGLILLSTVLFAIGMVVRQAVEHWLPIRHVDVVGLRHAETREGLRPVLERARGSLASIDLDALRRDFETLPWVRRAALSRVWPDRLRVELEEHVPAAAWNDSAILDIHGEVFPVRPWAGLPRFSAPVGTEKEVIRRYAEFARLLAGHPWRIEAIRMDARFAWQLVLADGPVVDLGRERLDERLRRFVVFYPRAAGLSSGIRHVDMRYPNGFAVRGGPAGLGVGQVPETNVKRT